MKALPKDWNRRLPLAAAALVFAAGNLVFFLGYRSSTHDRRAALEARRDELKRSVEAREAEATRLSGQRERLSGVSEAMEEFYGRRIGTQEETLAGLVADLHAALKESGIEANQISYTTTTVSKLPLTRMKIAFPVRCDYGRFKKLLKTFETGKRWIAIESVAIRRDTERPGSVNVQMELVTYFSDREGEPSTPLQRPAAPARGAVPAARSAS
jgi:Tfp pilus assembly protein PilO